MPIGSQTQRDAIPPTPRPIASAFWVKELAINSTGSMLKMPISFGSTRENERRDVASPLQQTYE
jgi:hypothetical protein